MWFGASKPTPQISYRNLSCPVWSTMTMWSYEPWSWSRSASSDLHQSTNHNHIIFTTLNGISSISFFRKLAHILMRSLSALNLTQISNLLLPWMKPNLGLNSKNYLVSGGDTIWIFMALELRLKNTIFSRYMCEKRHIWKSYSYFST